MLFSPTRLGGKKRLYLHLALGNELALEVEHQGADALGTVIDGEQVLLIGAHETPG